LLKDYLNTKLNSIIMSKKSCDFPRELLVALFSLLCTCSWAGPRSYLQAKAIAEKKAVEMGLQVVDGSSQENLAKGRLGVVEEQCPYYVFSNAEAKGFVIVSGDDRFPRDSRLFWSRYIR
jgi:hypothetical protein